MRVTDARSLSTVDDIDRAIIRELQDDGRKSIVAIADLIGLSEGAVRRRIDHLQAMRVLRIAGLPDPTAFGLQRHFIGILVNEESLDIVRGALVAMPEMSYVWETDGQYNLMAAAFFNGNDQLNAFLSGRLAKISGVRKLEVFRMRRTVKKTRRWPVPPLMSGNDAGLTN
jgi:Lrp/AsnC family transcriptional regulator, regulator for asnA, asnC and gidA